MSRLINRTIGSFCALISLTAYAQEDSSSKQAISIPNVYIASDSEGFSTYKYNAGYVPLYEHGEKYSGISYGHNYFTQNDWSSSAEVYTLFTKAINPRTGLGYIANIGYNLQKGHQLVTTDSSYGFRITDATKGEVFVARDSIETQNALNNGIYYTFPGASIEQQILKRLAAIAMVGTMYISDTNTRPTVKVKLIYDLVPEYGVTAQLRYRQFHNTNTSVPNNYFNPSTYNETMIAFGMRKRISGWIVSGTVGVGRQNISQDPTTTTQLYELGITSPVTSKDYYFKTRMGYGKSAGFSGPNYFYRYFMEEIIFPF